MSYELLTKAIQEKYGEVELFNITEIAEKLNMKPRKLNNLLEEKGFLERKKINDGPYIYSLKTKFDNQGFTYVDEDGNNYSKRLIYTPKGKDFILKLDFE